MSTEEAPIIHFIRQTLEEAVEQGASDIHLEPFEDVLQTRYRVNGSLSLIKNLPSSLIQPVISRIKVLAQLNMAEQRIPQDGSLTENIAGRIVAFRVSTLPTPFGESVVLRVLDQEKAYFSLDDLGLRLVDLEKLRTAIQQPYGMILLTGPTGSGKSTTLYAALREQNQPDVKILTVEDPVEQILEGVMQTQINPALGLTFMQSLRAFLRQDPDIIMLGEIRDVETAKVAVQAALTGHLVMSTLHTNDAISAVMRLIDMGIAPYLVTASLKLVIAQRLLRQLCPHCRYSYSPSKEDIRSLPSNLIVKMPSLFWHSKGCKRCQGTGSIGRLGIFESVFFSPSLCERIKKGISVTAIKNDLFKKGHLSLRDQAMLALKNGLVSAEEVFKV